MSPLLEFFLLPGQAVVTPRPSRVTTLLGSCVAVIFYSTRLGRGVVAHSMLSACPRREGCRKVCKETYRYVDCTVKQLLTVMDGWGEKAENLQAKLFGGADMYGPGGERTVGRLNVLKAKEAIADAKVPLVAEETGGREGRKIIFFTHTGEVFLVRRSSLSAEEGDGAVWDRERR